jgi:hypothetical protein
LCRYLFQVTAIVTATPQVVAVLLTKTLPSVTIRQASKPSPGEIMKIKLVLCASLAVIGMSNASAQSLYFKLGQVEGANNLVTSAGFSWPVTSNVALGFEGIVTGSKNSSITRSSITFTGEAQASGGLAYVAWFPLTGALSGINLKGGLAFNGSSGTSTGVPEAGNPNFNFAGKVIPFNASTDKFTLTANSNSISPYIGIGWGYAPSGTSGFGVSADIGISSSKVELMGIPNDYLLRKLDAAGGSQADINSKVKDIQDSVNSKKYRFSSSVGVYYKF